MSSFTDQVNVQVLGGGRYKLLESFEYYYAVGKDKTESIIMPKGTVTDFASTPAIIHWLLPPTDKHLFKPAIIHDILYSDIHMVNHSTGQYFTRKESDIEMFKMMVIVGAPTWKLLSVYIALRLFGWWGYNYEPKGQKKPLPRIWKDKIINYCK